MNVRRPRNSDGITATWSWLVAKNSKAHVAAGGRSRIVHDQIKRVEGEVRARYAERLASARFFRRLFLHMKIRREVSRELEKIAPSRGLYARR